MISPIRSTFNSRWHCILHNRTCFFAYARLRRRWPGSISGLSCANASVCERGVFANGAIQAADFMAVPECAMDRDWFNERVRRMTWDRHECDERAIADVLASGFTLRSENDF
jgi:hypothetical protein